MAIGGNRTRRNRAEEEGRWSVKLLLGDKTKTGVFEIIGEEAVLWLHLENTIFTPIVQLFWMMQ